MAVLGRGVKSAAGWVLTPVLAIFMLIVVVMALPSVHDAAAGRGTPGEFRAERRECPPEGFCSWYGVFSADDGSVRFTDALLDRDPVGWKPGSTARVVWSGATDPVAVYEPGDRLPLVLVLVLGLVAALGLAAWLVALTYRIRRRRYPRWIRVLQSPAHWD